MKVGAIAFAVSSLSLAGCAQFVAHSGTRLEQLTDREKVVSSFGSPISTETTTFEIIDEYHTRKKIAEPLRCQGAYYAMEFAVTLGLSELYSCPNELLRLAKTKLLGRTVKFIYHSNGKLIRIYVDGKICQRVEDI